MIQLDLLLEATQGELRYIGRQVQFPAFSHDTRQIRPGELFVAVRGERSDGHDYVFDAAQGGAGGLLLEARFLDTLSEEQQAHLEHADIPTVVVEDTRLALQSYARFILAHWHPTVIAVTGSVGKTSTKEAIATVLASRFPTFRSWQNYNDLLGLPLSLGRLEPEHRYAVLELGCDHPGEIADLCALVHPQIGVLTHISPVQLQYFGTLDRLTTEFAMLLEALPEDGILFYNNFDHAVRTLLSHTHRGQWQHLVPFVPSMSITVPNWDMVQDVHVTWNGIHCTLLSTEKPNTWEVQSIPLASHLLGEHALATLFAAYNIGRHVGMSIDEVQQAVAQISPLPGRLFPLAGVHGSRLLDDTHNAAPASVSAALRTLDMLSKSEGAMHSTRRIAVLGDMSRLGAYEEEAHRIVGREAAQHVDYLVVRGTYAAILADEAQKAGLAPERITITSTHEDAAQAVQHILNANPENAVGAVVLIKGSEQTRMERVTELLMAHPWEAAEQLVRQTPAWKQIIVSRAERPTWVEIDLGAIANNTRRIKSLVGERVQVLVSLKADAYGHGAVKVARTVLHNGATMLGVATLSEATPLREAGITAPILVFGYLPPWQMREAVRQQVTVTIYTHEAAQALSRAALALDSTVRVHLKVDTGMGRLGVRAEQVDEIVALARTLADLPGLVFEGLYTHLASADAADKTYTHMQLQRFQFVLHALEQAGLRPPLVHAANSAATLSVPEARFDLVRPGIAIYGLDPSGEVRVPDTFHPALSFKTQVAQVKLVPEGECIGYGCTYTTTRPTLVATLPVGYADGFRRAPRTWESVLLHGQEAPLVGRVCMDQCMIDVTHLPQTRIGDEVVLIGRQGAATLTAEQVASRLGTINYEVVSEILARVPRVD
jgi:alanine racemase